MDSKDFKTFFKKNFNHSVFQLYSDVLEKIFQE